MNRLLFLLAALATASASAHPHLLEAGSWPGYTLADYSDDERRPVSRMTREQLQDELHRIREEQPALTTGLGLTITGGCLLAVGAVGYVVGINMANSGSGFAATNADNRAWGALMAIAGVAAGITGGALLIVGVVKLIISHFRYQSAEEEIAVVKRRIQEVDGVGFSPPPLLQPVPQPLPAEPTVPPPPPFPDSNLMRPAAPAFQLVSF